MATSLSESRRGSTLNAGPETDTASTHHYLKGALTCDACGARLIYGKHRGKGGIYEYFSCVKRKGRNGGTCNTGHYSAPRIEIEVAALYWSLKLPPQQIAQVRKAVTALADEHIGVIQKAAARHRRRLQTLEDQQTKLLELHYKGSVSENVMRRQTECIEPRSAPSNSSSTAQKSS